MTRIALSLLTSALTASLLSAQETTEAPPMDVTAPPLVSVQQVGQDTSVATSLLFVPEVVVLTQGQPVGQSDLSIRNSSFSAAGLSVAGLALTNPQTEHFNAELPIPGWWLGSPQVLTGVSQARETEGHLTGTVLFTPIPLSPGSRVTAGVDEKGGYWLNANGETATQSADGSVTGFGAFAGHTEIPEVDFDDNDIVATRGGARFQKLTDSGQGDVMIGHQDKTFGARGYYGVNDALKAEESTKDTLAIASWQGNDPAEPLSASIMARRFEDDYKLWLPSSLFQNEHTNKQAAAQVSKRFAPREGIRVHTRLASDIEDIDSNSLGDFQRSRLAATVLPEFDLTDEVILTAGLRAEVLESYSDQLLPQVRLDVGASETVDLFAEYSASVRRPSYTELNYDSPGSLGNSGLDLQHQDAAEIGLNWQATTDTAVKAVVFSTRTQDTVDWVRPDATATRWQAENIGDVDTLGTELIATYRVASTLNLLGSWMWTDKQADDAPYASRYSLDYAENLVRIHLDWTPTPWVRLELAQLIRDQVDNALRTEGGDQQFLTNAALHLRYPELERVQLSLMVWNATDDDYRVFPGQDTVSGRRFSAAITVDL